MKITIESIPHAQQRYPTCGDWFFDGSDLIIKVSEEMGSDSAFLVALHELVEVWMATKKGVTVQQVDDFDVAYEKAHREGGTLAGKRLDETEPGNDPACPVYEMHQTATSVEQIVCTALGIPWKDHNSNVNKLP